MNQRKKVFIFVTLSILIATGLTVYSNYAAHGENIKMTEKYGEIDKLLQRVEDRVKEKSKLSFNKNDNLDEFNVKFIRHLYPDYEFVEMNNSVNCMDMKKARVVCANTKGEKSNHIALTVSFKGVDNPNTVDVLNLRLESFIAVDLDKKYNYDICKLSTAKDGILGAKYGVYFSMSTNDGPLGHTNREINKYYLSDCSSNLLREQLAKMNYKSFSPLEKQRIEEFIYVDQFYREKVEITSEK